jgi:hypothetical protein
MRVVFVGDEAVQATYLHQSIALRNNVRFPDSETSQLYPFLLNMEPTYEAEASDHRAHKKEAITTEYNITRNSWPAHDK